MTPEERRKKGKAYAEANRARLEKEVQTHDRFQASHFMRNMIKALEIHSFQNTVEDWQRYYEAKIVMAARRKPAKKTTARKNPKSGYKEGPWYVRKIGTDGITRTVGKKYKSYLAARRAANKMWKEGEGIGFRGIELAHESEVTDTFKPAEARKNPCGAKRKNPRAKAKYGVFKLTPAGRQYILSHKDAAEKKSGHFGLWNWASATNFPVEFDDLKTAKGAASLASIMKGAGAGKYFAQRLKKGGF